MKLSYLLLIPLVLLLSGCLKINSSQDHCDFAFQSGYEVHYDNSSRTCYVFEGLAHYQQIGAGDKKWKVNLSFNDESQIICIVDKSILRSAYCGNLYSSYRIQ